MLHSVTLCDIHAERVRGPRAIQFESGMNCLIGPNGSGKSSIIQAAIRCHNCKQATDGPLRFRFFDSERSNPRTQDLTSMARIVSMFASHGEIQKRILTQVPVDADLVLADEPEIALDLDGLFAVRDAFLELAKSRQVIVATHNPALWVGHRIILGGDPEYADKYMRRFGEALDRVEPESAR